jgi:hypothetical protein
MCSFRQMMQRRIMSPAVGRPLAGPRFAVGVLAPAARFGPAATWVELEIERAEPIQAEDDFGLAGLGDDLSAGDRVRALDLVPDVVDHLNSLG